MRVHVVFVTKYRRGVLTGQHHDTECNGEVDHAHLLVDYPPQVAISTLVNSLNGVSSRRLRQRHQVRTLRDHRWFPSYFAASGGGVPLSIIKQYVENQRRLT
jgi:putative transposase